jgi:NADH:ubiquinone oxidoreductase subunit 2 (subunit N)
VLAATLALFLLSLVGIPPLAGFVAKFYLFGSAVRAGLPLADRDRRCCNSAIAAYYYLRVIVYMYMREPGGEALSVASSLAGGLAPQHRAGRPGAAGPDASAVRRSRPGRRHAAAEVR